MDTRKEDDHIASHCIVAYVKLHTTLVIQIFCFVKGMIVPHKI